MKVDKRVGITSTAGRAYSSGIAQICIPPDVDRSTFVRNCLVTGFVSIQPKTGAAIHRVRCDKWVLQQITFPGNSEEFGSFVVYITEPKSKAPFVVSTFNSIEDYNDLNENQFRLRKETEDVTVDLIGDAESGTLTLNVSSTSEQKGQININLINPDDTAKFNVNIRGSANVFASSDVTLSTYGKMLLQASESSQETTSSITVAKDKINLDGGTEPMLLGKSTIDLLQELIDLLSTAVVMGQPLSTSVQIKTLSEKLEPLLSKKSNLD